MVKFIVIVFVIAWILGAVWFFRGPAKAANRYIDNMCASLSNADDGALLKQLYVNKHPKNVLAAWLLTSIFSPTISYLYQGEFPKALVAFITLEGLGIWWLVSIFSMPAEVMRHNKRLADQAMADLRLARPGVVTVTPTTAA